MKRGLPQLLPKKSNTKPERRFAEICKQFALPFKHVGDGSFWIEKTNPDFVDVDAKVAVFVDGCYWHGCPIHQPRSITHIPMARKRDAYSRLALRRNGWGMVRIWEHELNEPDITPILAKLGYVSSDAVNK